MKTIICADALTWLAENKNVGAISGSLPDPEEIGMEKWSEYEPWFYKAVSLCLESTSPETVTMFYQTDRKANGWNSKAAVIFSAARYLGVRCLWHKIVVRSGIGKIDLYRPGYTHLLCFSRKARVGKPTADVIERGAMIYPNATGLIAAEFLIRYAMLTSKRLADPFCGRGTIPAMADALGMDAIGIDIDPAQCEAAKKLRLTRDLAGTIAA